MSDRASAAAADRARSSAGLAPSRSWACWRSRWASSEPPRSSSAPTSSATCSGCGVALGCLVASLMLSHLTGGLWGARHPAPARGGRAHAARAGALLFLPLALRARPALRLGRPEVVAADALLQREGALPERAASSWRAPSSTSWSGSLLAHLLSRWSRRAGRGRRPEASRGEAARPRGARARAAGPDHHLRRRRLGDVARPALVLDHLRRAVHGGRRRSRRWPS